MLSENQELGAFPLKGEHFTRCLRQYSHWFCSVAMSTVQTGVHRSQGTPGPPLGAAAEMSHRLAPSHPEWCSKVGLPAPPPAEDMWLGEAKDPTQGWDRETGGA